MALIKCPECGKEISDRAISCPACGRPIVQATPIEITGKKWKRLQLLCALAILSGIIICGFGTTLEGSGVLFFGAFLSIGGLVGYFLVKVAAWWHHG